LLQKPQHHRGVQQKSRPACVNWALAQLPVGSRARVLVHEVLDRSTQADACGAAQVLDRGAQAAARGAVF
jgi:hypothetical protein